MRILNLLNCFIAFYFKLYISCLLNIILLYFPKASTFLSGPIFIKCCIDYQLFELFNIVIFFQFPHFNFIQVLILDFGTFGYTILCKDEQFILIYLLRAIMISTLLRFKCKVIVANILFPFTMTICYYKQNYCILFIYYLVCIHSKVEITCNLISLLLFIKYQYFTQYFYEIEEYKLNKKLKIKFQSLV